MKTRLSMLATFTAIGLLTGCQTATIKPEPISAATVDEPLFSGATRISVKLDEKTFTGVAGELHPETSREQALRFGWQPKHKHYPEDYNPHKTGIRDKWGYYFGSTIVTTADGEKLACDHLKHAGIWRLLCKSSDGKELALYRANQ